MLRTIVEDSLLRYWTTMTFSDSTANVATPTTLRTREGDTDRSLELIRRASTLRNGSRDGLGANDHYERAIRELLGVVVPFFSDVCAVYLPDGLGEPSQFLIRHHAYDSSSNGDQTHQDGRSELLNLVPNFAEISERVASSGQTETWSTLSDRDNPQCVMIALTVNDRAIGTVTFTLEHDRGGFGSAEVAAAEHVGWIMSNVIERVVLRRDARSAVRRTQRIATQLHQLIAASITVAGLRSEQDILLRLVTSARNVYGVDDAIVSLESGAFAPLCGIVLRGGDAVCLSPLDPTVPSDLPVSRPGFTTPWTDRDWLVAPLLERRNVTRGVIAIRRMPGTEFGAEEREVLALLAQMAMSALGAEELNRTVQRSDARLRILVETAPIGIVEVDADGDVRWWNRAASDVFAWPLYDEAKASPRPTFPKATVEGLRDLWKEVLSDDDVAGRDFVDVEIAGRIRVLTASATLLPAAASEAPAILTLIDDVTNHSELKAELRHAHTMEVRGQVASRIAHDFNNLLTLISGYAEMLANDLKGRDREVQMVHDIQVTASRASMLTTQLQTIGRTKKPAPVVFDPAVIIESNAEVLERILGSSIEVRWSLDRHAGNIRVDADQFEQMILNIVINARDAMPDGGQLTISSAAASFDESRAKSFDVIPGDFVQLSITDTGVGMDESTRQRCFDPLFTTKGPFKGTGLGLASARRLVQESGGSIRCTTQVAHGTTFEILLPVVSEPTQEVSVAVETNPPQGGATVLLVEDDDDLRRFMSQILLRNGYQVLEADSAERALVVANEFRGSIALLLSDVVMAEMSGRVLASTLQSADPNLRVLLVSGTANQSVVDELRSGTSAFLSKPFRPSQLIDTLHEILRFRPSPTAQRD
jgi:two-component system cell cycle sensor histidine kinase/response regulator CckA